MTGSEFGSFRYTIADIYGASAIARVNVIVRDNHAQSPNIVSIERLDAARIRITFIGIPGRTYGIQGTGDLSDPRWAR